MHLHSITVQLSKAAQNVMPDRVKQVNFTNRPFAAKPSRDLLFVQLWAATLRMPEMEKACRKHQNVVR